MFLMQVASPEADQSFKAGDWGQKEKPLGPQVAGSMFPLTIFFFLGGGTFFDPLPCNIPHPWCRLSISVTPAGSG